MGADPADRMGNEGGHELANRARNEAIKSDRLPFYATLVESMTRDDDARPAALLGVNTEHTMHSHHYNNAFKLHPRCKY